MDALQVMHNYVAQYVPQLGKYVDRKLYLVGLVATCKEVDISSNRYPDSTLSGRHD